MSRRVDIAARSALLLAALVAGGRAAAAAVAGAPALIVGSATYSSWPALPGC
jgi:hypothetical protein